MAQSDWIQLDRIPASSYTTPKQAVQEFQRRINRKDRLTLKGNDREASFRIDGRQCRVRLERCFVYSNVSSDLFWLVEGARLE